MNKDEMIEALKKDINTPFYNYAYLADKLINAGYRKVGEDEIVIKKSEYDILLKDYTTTYGNAYQWGLKVGEEKTAIEILQTILDESGIDMLGNCYRLPTRVFNKIKYKCGIELE